MEYISYRKMYLLMAIIILTLLTINKPHIDKRFKTIIFNPILKIALLSYLTYKSMFTIEFSLITAVLIVGVLELIDEMNHNKSEHFNPTTINQNVNGSNVAPTPDSNNNAANVPTNNNQSSNNSSSNNQQTSTNQITNNQPTANQPTNNQPTANQPTANQPTTNQPDSKQPVSNQPVSNQPVSNQPKTNQTTPSNKVDTLVNKGPNSTLSALDSVGIIKNKAVTSNIVTSSNNKPSVAPSAINSTLGLPNNNITSKQTLETNIVSTNSGTGVGSVPQTDDNYVLKDSTSNGNTNVSTKVTIICKPTIPTPIFSASDNDKYVVRFVINTSILTSDGNCTSKTTPININMTEGNYRVKSEEKDIDNDEDYLRVNYILVAINTEEKNISKGINLLIKQGYKIIMTSKTGKKVEFAATYDEDGLFIQSDDIKKALLNLNKIDIVTI
jgi:cell division protein FtsN